MVRSSAFVEGACRPSTIAPSTINDEKTNRTSSYFIPECPPPLLQKRKKQEARRERNAPKKNIPGLRMPTPKVERTQFAASQLRTSVC
jgi:hypothetical protein